MMDRKTQFRQMITLGFLGVLFVVVVIGIYQVTGTG